MLLKNTYMTKRAVEDSHERSYKGFKLYIFDIC